MGPHFSVAPTYRAGGNEDAKGRGAQCRGAQGGLPRALLSRAGLSRAGLLRAGLPSASLLGCNKKLRKLFILIVWIKIQNEDFPQIKY